jgi:hypothetical protein
MMRAGIRFMAGEEHTVIANSGALLWIDDFDRHGGAKRQAFIEAFNDPLLPSNFPQKLLDELSRENLVRIDDRGMLAPGVNAEKWVRDNVSFRQTVLKLTALLNE